MNTGVARYCSDTVVFPVKALSLKVNATKHEAGYSIGHVHTNSMQSTSKPNVTTFPGLDEFLLILSADSASFSFMSHL